MNAQTVDMPTQEIATPSKDGDERGDNFWILNELIEALGLHEQERAIIEASPHKLRKFELVDILNVLARLGYPARHVALRLRDLDPRMLPCLFVDDKKGHLRVVTKPSRERAAGMAYVFAGAFVIEAEAQASGGAEEGDSWVAATFSRFGTLFRNLLVISLVLNLVSLGLPVFLMVIYDRIVDFTTPITVYAIGGGAVVLLAVEWTLRRWRSQNLSWLAARFDSLTSNRIIARLFQLPASAIERASVVSQVARIKNFEAFRDFFTGSLFLTILDVPFVLLALGLLALIAGDIVFIPIATIVVLGMILLIFHPVLKRAMLRSAQSRSSTQAHQIELIEKIQALRLNGMSEVWFERFRDISAAGSIDLFRSQYLGHMLETIIHAVVLCAGLGVIYAGTQGVWNGTLTGGGMFAALLLLWRILGPLQTLGVNVPRLLQIRRTFQQIDRLMEIETERERALGLGSPDEMKGSVKFSRVGLRYSKISDPVFAGLSFTIEPGQLAVIAGGNGSGKTTVLKLILDMYRPQAGAIYLDDRDIRQLDPVLVRKAIAYIPQVPEMFIGTIAENVKLANPAASDEQVWEAVYSAGIETDITNLPYGLDTLVGASGARTPPRLNYGISIARAFVKDAPLLLLDELPYNILNSDLGTRLIRSIQRLQGEKTIVMVSHRDDHIKMADYVIGLLEGGRSTVGSAERVISALHADAIGSTGRAA